VSASAPETRTDILQKVDHRQYTPEEQPDRHQNNTRREQKLGHPDSAIATAFPMVGKQGFGGHDLGREIH